MTFTITLSDGTKLEGLSLNGNNFISATALSASDFAGKLSPVKIQVMLGEEESLSDGESYDQSLIGDHAHMKLVQCVEYENAWWFVLADITKQELREKTIDARLDYIEMMEGIE